MTSASDALQCGQRGSGSGLFRGGWRRVLLLLEAAQHAECVRVDRTRLATPSDRIPAFPIDAHAGCLHLELLLQVGSQLGRTHAELALAVKDRRLAVGRAEPFDRLPPRALERCRFDA